MKINPSDISKELRILHWATIAIVAVLGAIFGLYFGSTTHPWYGDAYGRMLLGAFIGGFAGVFLGQAVSGLDLIQKGGPYRLSKQDRLIRALAGIGIIVLAIYLTFYVGVRN